MHFVFVPKLKLTVKSSIHLNGTSSSQVNHQHGSAPIKDGLIETMLIKCHIEVHNTRHQMRFKPATLRLTFKRLWPQSHELHQWNWMLFLFSSTHLRHLKQHNSKNIDQICKWIDHGSKKCTRSLPHIFSIVFLYIWFEKKKFLQLS